MANRDIITRGGKGSDLDATDHDQNHKSFAGTVEEQTGTTYEVVYTDQNKTIELNNASMVCTLDAISDIHTAIDTDNFEVTLKNTNAAAATVQRSSTDTIEGSTSITIIENEVIILQTDSTGGEWTIKSTGVISSNAALSSPTITTATFSGTQTGFTGDITGDVTGQADTIASQGALATLDTVSGTEIDASAVDTTQIADYAVTYAKLDRPVAGDTYNINQILPATVTTTNTGYANVDYSKHYDQARHIGVSILLGGTIRAKVTHRHSTGGGGS
jgi:hypothetical protein